MGSEKKKDTNKTNIKIPQDELPVPKTKKEKPPLHLDLSMTFI